MELFPALKPFSIPQFEMETELLFVLTPPTTSTPSSSQSEQSLKKTTVCEVAVITTSPLLLPTIRMFRPETVRGSPSTLWFEAALSM